MARATKNPRSRTSSVPEIAAFAGVSRHTIYEWAKLPGYPKGDDGSVCLWDLAVWRQNYEAGDPGDESEDLPFGSSPALEEFRRERALLAKYQRLERERQLMPMEWVTTVRGRDAQKWRAAQDQCQRAGDMIGYQIIQDVLEDYRREELGEDDQPAGPGLAADD